MDKDKIIIIGAGVSKTALIMAKIEEEFGKDVVVLTSDEAQEKGMLPDIKQKPFIFQRLPELKMPEINIYEKNKQDCKKGWRK